MSFCRRYRALEGMSWHWRNELAEKLAESLSYDAITQLDIHTIFYPPSVVLAFWACVFLVQFLDSDKKNPDDFIGSA